MGFLVASSAARAATAFLLLDFVDARHRPMSLHELAAACDGVEPTPKLFVCNPISGQLVRLLSPAWMCPRWAPFRPAHPILGSDGPPDRYGGGSAQQKQSRGGDCRRSPPVPVGDRGGDERPLVGAFEMDPGGAC
ncbi:hypothetical protein ZWY2020_047975 [Hordeum vulgare]|nr:hypothetical protein ZWY2020_047975 [Hordeum vulgare]